MAKHAKHESATPATEWLKAHGVTFREFSYDYVEHGGTHKASESLGLNEHATIKTLIMENESAKPLVILMHGDCEVSTKISRGRSAARASRPASLNRLSAIPATWSAARVPSAPARKCPFTFKKQFLSYRKSLSTAAVAVISSVFRHRSLLKNWAPFP